MADPRQPVLCVACRTPRPADVGFVCEHHLDAAAGMLHDIEREAADHQYLESGAAMANLDPVPSMAIAWDRGGGTLASEQAPARLNVLVHRDFRIGAGLSEEDEDAHAAGGTLPVLLVLHQWAEQVRADRPLSRPTRSTRVRTPRWQGPVHEQCGHASCRAAWIVHTVAAVPTVASERDVLSRNLDWIARQRWMEDFYTQMRTLLAQLRRTNGTHTPGPLPGRCPNLIDGHDCGGPLWPDEPTHTAGEDVWVGSTPSAVACAACKTRWEGPGGMARLVLMLEAARRAPAAP